MRFKEAMNEFATFQKTKNIQSKEFWNLILDSNEKAFIQEN